MSAFTDRKDRNEQARELKKQEILNGYNRLVKENGFENAAISKIAAEVGIPSSLIFHYFKNKQELTYALIDHVMEKAVHSSIPAINKETDDVQREFIEFIDAIFDVWKSYPFDEEVYIACQTMALRDPVAKEIFVRYYALGEVNRRNILQFFSDRGVIKINNMLFAGGLLGMLVEGLENLSNFSQNTEELKNVAEESKRIFYEYVGFQRT